MRSKTFVPNNNLQFADVLKLTCVLANVPTTALVDVPTLSKALCTNVTRLSEVSICVQKSCDWPDQAKTEKVQNSLCAGFPIESRSTGLVILAAVMASVTFPIVGLKLYTRWTSTGHLWADDYTIIAASVRNGPQ